MSMFDFNQDGNNELVYRDQTNLRIVKGTDGLDMNDPTLCSSATADEYPLVADINGDGAAEIIVTGGTKVWVYSSDPSGLWAPARKVWTQIAYNVVNFNEDLTVPRVQMNPATVFPGPDGQLGTSDDVRPYNGYLQQQTTLSKNGVSYWDASDYAFEGLPETHYDETADTLSIKFCVKNYGDVQGSTPFYVSVYKNERKVGNVVATKSYDSIPGPGQEICDYTIMVKDVLESSLNINSLHLWLNDNQQGKSVNAECDYTNGVVIYDVSSNIATQDDYAALFTCEATTIPILANDTYAGTSYTITTAPKDGTATPPVGGVLAYTNDGGVSSQPCGDTGNRTDTIRYKIQSIVSAASAIEADVVIKIYNKPEMLLEDACSANPKIALSNSYDGFTYKWEYSLDGASGWENVTPANNRSTKLNITRAGFYRLTIYYDNGKTHQLQQGIEVIANRTLQLPGGIVWYEFESNPVDIIWQ
jgi:hypothetical protein